MNSQFKYVGILFEDGEHRFQHVIELESHEQLTNALLQEVHAEWAPHKPIPKEVGRRVESSDSSLLNDRPPKDVNYMGRKYRVWAFGPKDLKAGRYLQ